MKCRGRAPVNAALSGARGADLQAAVADTEPFELAPSPRRLHVVTPGSECGIPAGPVTLGAMIDNRSRRAPTPPEIRWHSNLQGELGRATS